ncbi:HNH endonuclease [Nonomuraea sp. GTA35]|uniref:HNH endonuclease n=1 Tax=Nonomuraea sp. GTA35 TaxID=1676746 RepID=UPI0035C25043
MEPSVERFQGRCAYCGLPPRPGEVLEQDHVVPLSRGGAHSEENILPACDTCNVRKSDRLIVEWRFGKRIARRHHKTTSPRLRSKTS